MGLSRSTPCFIIGDLNVITDNHEKQGGKLRHASTFVAFNLMKHNCGLVKFPCLVNSLSWRRRRSSQIVRCRLDRVLVNEDWHSIFQIFSLNTWLWLNRIIDIWWLQLKTKYHITQSSFGLIKSRLDMRVYWKQSLMVGKTCRVGIIYLFMEKISNCRREISKWKKNNQAEEWEQILDL